MLPCIKLKNGIIMLNANFQMLNTNFQMLNANFQMLIANFQTQICENIFKNQSYKTVSPNCSVLHLFEICTLGSLLAWFIGIVHILLSFLIAKDLSKFLKFQTDWLSFFPYDDQSTEMFLCRCSVFYISLEFFSQSAYVTSATSWLMLFNMLIGLDHWYCSCYCPPVQPHTSLHIFFF